MQSDNMNAYEYSAKNRFRETEEENYTTDFLFDRGIEFMEKAKIRNEPFAYVLSIPGTKFLELHMIQRSHILEMKLVISPYTLFFNQRPSCPSRGTRSI
jgi:hypothetical protein